MAQMFRLGVFVTKTLGPAIAGSFLPEKDGFLRRSTHVPSWLHVDFRPRKENKTANAYFFLGEMRIGDPWGASPSCSVLTFRDGLLPLFFAVFFGFVCPTPFCKRGVFAGF